MAEVHSTGPSSSSIENVTHDEDQPSIFEEGDVSEDIVEEVPPSVTVTLEGEDDIQRSQKLDFVSTISSLRLNPTNHSRMRIPLCRLVPMPMVRPTLSCDLTKLEQEFIHGYEEGARVFYVSISDEQGQSGFFSEAEKAKWGAIWNSVNDEFNALLQSQPGVEQLVDAKFYVCDGNHRCIAWMKHIDRLHSADLLWHISVDSIILETKGRIGVAMQVMHDINK
jgi:hypothetical protein